MFVQRVISVDSSAGVHSGNRLGAGAGRRHMEDLQELEVLDERGAEEEKANKRWTQAVSEPKQPLPSEDVGSDRSEAV